jgi:hypothetical protein
MDLQRVHGAHRHPRCLPRRTSLNLIKLFPPLNKLERLPGTNAIAYFVTVFWCQIIFLKLVLYLD